MCNRFEDQSDYSNYWRIPDVVCCYTFGISVICIHVNFICVFRNLKFTKVHEKHSVITVESIVERIEVILYRVKKILNRLEHYNIAKGLKIPCCGEFLHKISRHVLALLKCKLLLVFRVSCRTGAERNYNSFHLAWIL